MYESSDSSSSPDSPPRALPSTVAKTAVEQPPESTRVEEMPSRQTQTVKTSQTQEASQNAGDTFTASSVEQPPESTEVEDTLSSQTQTVKMLETQQASQSAGDTLAASNTKSLATSQAALPAQKDKEPDQQPEPGSQARSQAADIYTARRTEPGRSSRIWQRAETEILEKQLEDYMKLTTGKEKREHIRHKVLKEIKMSWVDRYSDENLEDVERKEEWRKKKRQVFNWYLNHGRKEKPLKVRGIRQLTLADVIGAKMKEEVHDIAKQLSGAEAGHPDFIKVYKKAIKAVQESLDDTELEAMKNILNEWNENGPDPKERARYAERHGWRMIRKMDEMKFKMMGMRSFTLECHYDSKDQMSYCFHDYTADMRYGSNIRIVPFHEYNPGAVKAIELAYEAYASHIAMIEKGGQPTQQSKLVTEEDIQYNETGQPIVPPETKNAQGVETRKMQVRMIRSFMTIHYRIASGLSPTKSRRSVPWAAIRDNPIAFTTTAYLPPNIKLEDPSKMAEDGVGVLIAYWRERQAEGENPFKFHSVQEKKGVLKPAIYPTAPPKKITGGPPAALTLTQSNKVINNGKQDNTDRKQMHGKGKEATKKVPKRKGKKKRQSRKAADKSRGNADISPQESIPGDLLDSTDESDRARANRRLYNKSAVKSNIPKAALKASNTGIPTPAASTEPSTKATSPNVDNSTLPRTIHPRKYVRVVLTPADDGCSTDRKLKEEPSGPPVTEGAIEGHHETPPEVPDAMPPANMSAEHLAPVDDEGNATPMEIRTEIMRTSKRTIKTPKKDDEVVPFTQRKSGKRK